MQTRFLIITGMSGAGKTQVVRTLEDLKYFCIDNLPAALIPKFAELCRQTSESNVALVVDVRGGQFFDKLLQVLDEITALYEPFLFITSLRSPSPAVISSLNSMITSLSLSVVNTLFTFPELINSFLSMISTNKLL